MSCHSISSLRHSYNYTCSLSLSVYSFLLYSFTISNLLMLLFLVHIYLFSYHVFQLTLPISNLLMLLFLVHICLLLFLISGPNMSSTFIILCMAVFLTQWAFHRVQERPNRSSGEGDMTIRSWRSCVVNLDELT